jgi:hypothetical protein
MTKITKPHRDLGPTGRRYWRDIIEEYGLSDSPGLRLLEVACFALDRMAEAREVIAKRGVLLEDGRLNPAVKAENDARNGFLSATRLLHFDVEPLGKPGEQKFPPSGPRSIGANSSAISTLRPVPRS